MNKKVDGKSDIYPGIIQYKLFIFNCSVCLLILGVGYIHQSLGTTPCTVLKTCSGDHAVLGIELMPPE